MNDETRGAAGGASKTAHERIDEAAEGVKERATSGADRVEEAVHRAADYGARGAHRAADKAAEWERRGAAAAGEAQAQATDTFERACQFVRERPVESVAIALATGWLAARVFRPRR